MDIEWSPTPHGGKLISRFAPKQRLEQLRKKDLQRIEISKWTLSDLELIGIGGFSPLTGFMNKDDYTSVLNKMRLIDGTVWPLPIILPVSEEESSGLIEGSTVLLTYNNKIYGSMEIEEKYKVDRKEEAMKVFGTLDPRHPGVEKTINRNQINIAGPITLFETPDHKEAQSIYYTPKEVRQLFKEKGWNTVVGFQTRNPVHRAHEYIQKCALETVDGLFLQPLIGETKADDIPANVRLAAYKTLLENYYPQDRVILGVYPGAMRYAGPKEALLHAIVRKNYGCTHFIIGRDHAGVGDFYGTYDSQKIFDQFAQEEIGIQILKFENSFYCERCESMATEKTCPHGKEHRISLSGTKVRRLLADGSRPPKSFSRPEVIDVLIKALRPDDKELN